MLPEAAVPPEVEWWDKPLLVGGTYFTEGSQQADGQQPTHEESNEQQQDPDDNVIAAASDGSGAVMRLRIGKVSTLREEGALLARFMLLLYSRDLVVLYLKPPSHVRYHSAVSNTESW
jgi:hypothetical protein